MNKPVLVIPVTLRRQISNFADLVALLPALPLDYPDLAADTALVSILGQLDSKTSTLATQGTLASILAQLDVALSTRATGAILNPHPVSLASIPNPSNLDIAISLLARETTLGLINGKLVNGTDIGDVTINNAAGAAAVNIQDGGNSVTVDGSVGVSGTLTQSTKHDTKTYLIKYFDLTATGLLSCMTADNKVLKVHRYSLQSTVDGVTVYFYKNTGSAQISRKWVFNAREAQETPFASAPAYLFINSTTNDDIGLNISGGTNPHVYGEIVYSIDDAS